MVKLLTGFVAVLLILGGLIVLPMPIPLGAIMIVCGLVLLLSVSSWAALRLQSFRRRCRSANIVIQTVEDKLPEAWKKVLKRSDP